MEQKICYSEALNMDEEELIEANYALDYYIELLKKQAKKKSR
jgi:hypothetical protein